MPELAEVEFFRRRWWEAGARRTVRAAQTQPRSRVYRRLARELTGGAAALAKILAGARLVDSATHGKQMWFVFKLESDVKRRVGTPLRGVRGQQATSLQAGNSLDGRLGEASLPLRREHGNTVLWLGLHMGMTGELRVEGADYRAQKHDALILRQAGRTLVFCDPRQFGRVRAWAPEKQITRIPLKRERGVPTIRSADGPPWLQKLPAEILSDGFTAERVRAALARHARAPVKAVLLDQRHFPGVGNWMADEILWRAAIHPARPAGRAAAAKIAAQLHATIQEVTRDALRVIAGLGGKLPSDLNVHIPEAWLFNHRWADGGVCPKTKRPLRRAEIGGRTTCWSPARQKR
jgi:formamidopyrimidine-DNA glycosylase